MAHEDYKEMLIARVLDALDDSDVRVVDEHLATCPECSAELQAWRDTAGLLAHGAPLVEPSPIVGKRIMKQVRSGRSERAVGGAEVVPMPARERAKTNIWPTLLRIAAAIAFVALIFGTFVF